MGWICRRAPLPVGQEAQVLDVDGELDALKTGDLLTIESLSYDLPPSRKFRVEEV
jgi:hypothetical protein